MADSSSAIPKPTAWQIALAQCLLRQKPDGISFKDYLLQLRESISTDSTKRQHLGPVSDIQKRFNEAQLEIHRLQSRLELLQRENYALIAAQPVSRKRKATTEPQQTRRSKRLQQPESTVEKDQDLASLSTDLEVDPRGSVVASRLYAIRQEQKQGISNPETFAAMLIHAANELGKLLKSNLVSFSPAAEPQQMPGRDSPPFFRAIVRSFNIITHGFSSLSRAATRKKRSCLGNVCCACVTLFEDLVRVITSCSIHGLEASARAPKRKSAAQRTQGTFMQSLTKLSLELLGCLSPICSAHFDLFEGISFVVIDRSATLLYNVEFGHERGASIDEELEMDEATIGAIPSSPSPRPLPSRTARLAGEEAKYIFPVLKRIVAMALLFYQVPEAKTKRASAKSAGLSRSKTSGSNYSSRRAAKLSMNVREKLQQTLINCIWDEHDEENEFSECLRKPVFQGPLPQLPKECTDDTPNWFKGEIWQLLGWEELGRERGLQLD